LTDAAAWFAGFEARDFEVGAGQRLHARVGGTAGAPPLLLLHGFPQTHAMWHRVARRLAPHFRLVLADLPGYGDSSKPADGPDHAPHGKRAMAAALHALMASLLGHARYFVCGHDRGGRVAARLALDEPAAVARLALIDIAPTLDMYAATSMDFARLYYHWFHLIQPAPLPEAMIAGDPIGYLHAKLGRWGGHGLAHVEPEALAEYERCWRDPATVHAACEDYRASAGIDLDHDRDSRARGRKIGCPMLVMWGARGVVARLFDPPSLWQAQCADTVQAARLDAGHYIPEELPEETASRLRAFFLGAG
jgi:haloacetate dehalogenase